jgi:hypothetical protein
MSKQHLACEDSMTKAEEPHPLKKVDGETKRRFVSLKTKIVQPDTEGND